MSPLLIAFALFTQTPDAAAPVGQPAEAPKAQKEKKICRAAVTQTASRMRKRECFTESEWARRDAGASAADLKTIGGR